MKNTFAFILTILFVAPTAMSQVGDILTDTLDEMVYTASRYPEKIVDAPASVQILNSRDLSRFAGSNILELVSEFRGIEFTRYGVDGITLNSRGFHSAFNHKVLQIVDGRISTAPMSGSLPVLNNGTTVKDDIQQYEVVAGPYTALYGPNAHNAVLNTITKHPRTYPGTTVAMSLGNQNQVSGRLRYARVIDDRWAYKVSGEFARGTEFPFYDSVYATPAAPGIAEYDVDFNFKHLRGEGHIYYRLTDEAEMILSGGRSHNDWLQVTTTGRNQFKGTSYGFLQARYVHPSLYVNVYNTWGSLGDNSYIIKPYTLQVHNLLKNGVPLPTARQLAIENTHVREESQRFNAEIQYNKKFENAGLDLIASLDYQNQRPNGFGRTLVDDNDRIRIHQLGGVIRMEKKLPLRFRITGAMRFDHHSDFGDFLAPKLNLVKQFGDAQVWFGFAKAYAMPTIQHQYAGVNRFYFGNSGEGIQYIPNQSNFSDPSSIRFTEPLKPEEVSSWELGFKGKVSRQIFMDISGYYAKSKNFITPTLPVLGRALAVNGIPVTHNPMSAGTVESEILQNATFVTNFNFAKVYTWGIDYGVNWSLHKHIRLAINYSWIDSDITAGKPENDANRNNVISNDERSLNAPHHRISSKLLFTDMLQGKFYCMLGARYVQEYDFYSGAQIGTEAGKDAKGQVEGNPAVNYNFDWGPLGGFTTFDFRTGYALTEALSVNLSISNLLNKRQIEFVGSPSIGRLIMAEVRVHL